MRRALCVGPAVPALQDRPLKPMALPPPRYGAGTMPWGHPGEHHDFEPQRHDDGYLEVIGFTMTSLVSGPGSARLEAGLTLCLPRSLQCPGARLQDGKGGVTKPPFSDWGCTVSSL